MSKSGVTILSSNVNDDQCIYFFTFVKKIKKYIIDDRIEIRKNNNNRKCSLRLVRGRTIYTVAAHASQPFENRHNTILLGTIASSNIHILVTY